MPSQSWSGTVTDGSSWVWPEPVCGQCAGGHLGTWVRWIFCSLYSVAMTIDDQESAGAARPGHGAGAWGRQGWAWGTARSSSSESMNMSIEHDLPLDARVHSVDPTPLPRAPYCTVPLNFPNPGAGLLGLLAPSCSSPHRRPVVGLQKCTVTFSISPRLDHRPRPGEHSIHKPTSPPAPAHPRGPSCTGPSSSQSGQAAVEQDALDWAQPCNVPRQGISPTPCSKPPSVLQYAPATD